MKHIVASLALTTLLVGCVTSTDAPVDDSDPTQVDPTPAPIDPKKPGFFPKTCEEARSKDASAKDAEYHLFVQNQPSLPWTAYCHDMQGSPREYLTLPQGAGKNTAMHAASAKAPGTDVVTVYQRVRVDPLALTIDIGDQTFATSTGSLLHAGTTVDSMPFGVAMTCGGLAKANIDVSGTPFHPEDQFPLVGTGMTPTWKLSADKRSVDMSVDGTDCGFVGATFPVGTLPVNDISALKVYLAYTPG